MKPQPTKRDHKPVKKSPTKTNDVPENQGMFHRKVNKRYPGPDPENSRIGVLQSPPPPTDYKLKTGSIIQADLDGKVHSISGSNYSALGSGFEFKRYDWCNILNKLLQPYL